MDTLGAEPGVGGLTTELELSLLAVVGALGTGRRTFVAGRAGDTCVSKKSCKSTVSSVSQKKTEHYDLPGYEKIDNHHRQGE